LKNTMKNGIDTNRQTGSAAACLKQNGIDFVFRYCSPSTKNPDKNLTANEAAALAAANLEIGVVFEDSPMNVTVTYFTNARGVQDGENAWNFTQTVGQPAGSCVYFAVDFDAAPEEIDAIVDYFRGVQAAMNTAADGASAYALGVYGSGIVCQAVKEDNGLATFSWLTLSQGWRGVKTYAGWDVNQARSTATLCELTVVAYDKDQSQDNFGGFIYQPPQPQAVG
jgi:hypothetical protein